MDHGTNADAVLISGLARALGRAVPEDALLPLAQYAGLVRTWSRKVNLGSARNPATFAELLFADALILAAPDLVPRSSRLVDIGAGAGAPTLPLLLLRPDLRAACVEARLKRAAFLRTASERLGLGARLQVVERRLDPDAPALDGAPFDVALSRATLAPARWLRMGAALAPRIIVFTAREAPPAPPADLRLAVEVGYALPSEGAPRRIAVFEPIRAGGADATGRAPG